MIPQNEFLNTLLETSTSFTIDPRTTTSGVSALTLATGTAPTIASAATAYFNSSTFTPGTVNFSGSTQITSTGTSANNALLFNQPTINRTDAASSLTIDQASNMFISGPTIASHATVGQTETITASSALRIGAGSTVAGTRGVVTNAYGLYVDVPTGGTNNYAATFAGGNVGVGTTGPGTRLHTLDNTTTGPLGITIENDGATTSNLLMFRIIDEVGGANNVKFSIDSDGDLLTDGSTTIGTPADVAEMYPVAEEGLEPGDIVALSAIQVPLTNTEDSSIQENIGGIVKATQNSLTLFGVISTDPGLILAGYTENSKPVALLGRVPVKLSNEGGAISIGDRVSVSSSAGVGKKASSNEPTIGIALEPFDKSEVGTVMVFLNLASAVSKLTVEQSGSGQIVYTKDQLKSDLASIGLVINEYGVIEVKKIKIEDAIIIKDKATGEYYCVTLENGEFVKEKGECEDSNSAQTEPVVEQAQAPTTEPEAEDIAQETVTVEETTVDQTNTAEVAE